MEDTVPDDAAHLKNLRLAAGLDLAQLAVLSNLSAGQVRQLEEGGESLFYSAQIKAQSMRRVIRLLETPAELDKEVESAGSPSLRSSTSVIDDIIRLSEKSLKSTVVHSEVRRRRGVNVVWLASAALAVGVFGFAVWQSNQTASHRLYSEWVEPLSSQVNAETAAPVPQAMPDEPPPYKADKLTTEAVSPTSVPPMAAAAPAPAPPLATTATPVTTASSTSTPCANNSSEPARIANLAVKPSKPGNYVYLVANKTMDICVDDGKHKQTLVTLKPGAGRTVHGPSPWTIAAQDLSSVQIYFQGAKVGLPADAGQRILLNEQALAP
jgi:transcriptional regulator with XRE-family HTH domain